MKLSEMKNFNKLSEKDFSFLHLIRKDKEKDVRKVFLSSMGSYGKSIFGAYQVHKYPDVLVIFSKDQIILGALKGEEKNNDVKTMIDFMINNEFAHKDYNPNWK